MPSKKQPAVKTAKTTTDQQPAAAPTTPAEQPPIAPAPPAVPPLFCHFSDLGQVRALPEAPTGDTLVLGHVQFEPGSIEQFADADGRTMRLVNVGGHPHKYPVPDSTDPQPEQEN